MDREDLYKLGKVAGGAFAVGAAVVAAQHLTKTPPIKLGSASISDWLVSVVQTLLPGPDSVLGGDDPRWHECLGGMKPGEGKWGYYEAGYGTTCGIFAAYCLAKAKGPPEMINRDPPEGSDFKVGEHISRLLAGGEKLGWVLRPTNNVVDLKPGDIYCCNREGAVYNGKPVSGEHVGIVLSVSGSDVETADGGQTDSKGRQCAMRRRRKLEGEMLNLVTGPAKVVWWLRAPPKGR